MTDADLITQFVASFEKLDDLLSLDPTPPELAVGGDELPGGRMRRWRPLQVVTERSAIDDLYRQLPGRFPPLFEELVMSFRWLEVQLDDVVRLFPNPPGKALEPLLAKITADRAFVKTLFPLGLIPFGHASDYYDPLCFDTRRRHADGDCPVIRVEHEAVLCDLRLGESWEVVESCRSLMNAAIAAARRHS